MNLIVENEALGAIVAGINSGIYEFEDPSKLRIVNKAKPGFVIVVMEFDLTEQIGQFIEFDTQLLNKTPNTKINFETNTFDFIVITMAEDKTTNTKTLVNTPLFELVVASHDTIADSTGWKPIDTENVDESWSLSSRGWNCYEV